MARKARQKSSTGIYHVIIRGIGKQILFEEDQDRQYFLNLLKKYKSEQQISLYCYCLMENHVHLLVHDKEDCLDMFMKKVEGSYAFYYNQKYERSGSLFQGRYKSEPVENDAYFKTVIRYILKNPEKALICKAETYVWSSCAEYKGEKTSITDTDYVIHHFGSRQKLLLFLKEENDDKCLEITPPAMTDTRAQKIIREVLSVNSGTALQAYGRAERDEAIRALKSMGLSVRQIERLTGINRGIVLKA